MSLLYASIFLPLALVGKAQWAIDVLIFQHTSYTPNSLPVENSEKAGIFKILLQEKHKNSLVVINLNCGILSFFYTEILAKMSEVNRKVALLTGITGQDGSYLAELLLDKGYTVRN